MSHGHFGTLLNEFSRAQEHVNRLVQRFGPAQPGALFGLGSVFPPLNAWDDEDAIYVEAELPGLSLDKLEIYVTDGNQLTIKGERTPPTEPKSAWHRQERGFGGFTRTLTLPVLVDSDKVEARLELGVLQLKLPKSPKAKPRRIQVTEA